jgi:hypothetical protein
MNSYWSLILSAEVVLSRIQNGSGAHPASYPMGTRGVKLTTHLHVVPTSVSGAIPPLPNTPSWRGDQLKHGDNFNFISLLDFLKS